MPRSTTRERRLKLFHRGNSHCPICLVEFTHDCVTAGQGVTVEHAPPRAKPFHGAGVCLTCEDCNNNAGGSADQALVLSQRRPKAELDINGNIKRSARYYHEGMPQLPIKPGSTPASRQLWRELREGTVVAAAILKTEEATTVRRITMSVREPDPREVESGYLKAAYLLVFSLLGKSGYLYARSEAVRPIREQIINPNCQLGPSLVRAFDDNNQEYPSRMVIMRNKQQPFCWIVKIDDRCVLLPHGGCLTDYKRIAQLPGAVELGPSFVGWKVQGLSFGSVSVHLCRLRHCDPSDQGLFGKDYLTTAKDGEEQRWVVVNQAEDILAVAPLGAKTRP